MIIKKYKNGWFIFLLLSSFVKWTLLRTTKCWSCISRADSFFTHPVIGQLNMTLMIQKYVVQFQISIHNTWNCIDIFYVLSYLCSYRVVTRTVLSAQSMVELVVGPQILKKKCSFNFWSVRWYPFPLPRVNISSIT